MFKRNKTKFKVIKLNKVFIYILVFFLIIIVLAKCTYALLSKFVSSNFQAFYKSSVSYTLKDSLPDGKTPFKIDAKDFLKTASIGFFRDDLKPINPPSIKAENSLDKNDTSPDITVNSKSVISAPLTISNETTYQIDSESIVNTPKTYNASQKEPKVLIMHTHATESYIDLSSSYRSEDKEKNMVYIGNVIENELKKRGISVIHDETLCDMPSYNNSYVKALELISSYTKKYPTIEFVFDIHRDAISDKNGVPTKLVCENDKNCAQAMIVCGTDLLGLYHPYWMDNLTLGLKIQKKASEKYPGLLRNLNLRKERFNMHMTKGSLIFEIGTYANSMNEAKNCAVKLSEIVSDVLLNK